MMRRICAFLLVALLVSLLTGCFQSSSPGGSPAPAERPPSGEAALRFKVELPKTTTRAAIDGSIVAGVSSATVTMTLIMVNPGNAAQPTITMIKTVPVSSGSASVSFVGLPVRTTVGEISISGGTIGGYSEFQGAGDLQDGDNLMNVSPVGSGLESDFLANVVKSILRQPEVAAKVPNNLVTALFQSLEGTDFTTATATLTVVNKLTERFAPDSFVKLTIGADRTTITGETQGTVRWTQTSSTIWNGVDGLSAGAADMLGDQVVRHGMNGFGYISWFGQTASLFGLTRLDSGDGKRLGSLLNPGECPQMLPLDNGDVIGGGYHSVYNCPVLFRWSGTTTAWTDLASGTGSSGFAWVHILREYADVSLTEKPRLIQIRFDPRGKLVAHLRDGAKHAEQFLTLDPLSGNIDPVVVEERMRLSAVAGEGQVTLTWPTGLPTDFYTLYYATASGVTKLTGNSLRGVTSPYVHTGLQNGTPHFYVLTKGQFSAEGLESVEVSATPKATINQLPVVSVTSPASGTSLPAGASLTVEVFAHDSDGSVARVELFLDEVKVGEQTTAPYAFPLSYLPLGAHLLQVRAIDDSGGTAFSAKVPIVGTGSAGGRIDGTLKDDQTGLPIAGALVGIAGTSIYTVTDANGFFELLDLAPGTYDLVVKRAGYAPKTIPGVVVTL